MQTLLQLIDQADRSLGEARLAAQGQNHAAALAAIDDARLSLAQARILIERPATGEYPIIKKP